MNRDKILELIELTEDFGPSNAEKVVRFWKNWREIEKRAKKDYGARTWQEAVGCEDGYAFSTNYGFLKCTANTLKDYFENKEELPEKTVNEIEFILDYGQTKLIV